MKKTSSDNAYTLIEVAFVVIVLSVILGLVVNIKANNVENHIKRAVSELQEYKSSIVGFKRKYGFLPGDLTKTQIFSLSLNNTDGNQNGLIEDKNQLNGVYDKNLKMDGEIANFWLHLYRSGFLKKTKSIFPYVPFLKTGILVFSNGERNFYHLAISGVNINKDIKTINNLTPYEAYLIDKKLDDGLPFSGNVFAYGGNTINNLKLKSPNPKCATDFEYLTVYRKKLCQLVYEIDI